MSKLTKKELAEIAKAIADIENDKKVKENIAFKKKRVKSILNEHASKCNQKSYIINHILEINSTSMDLLNQRFKSLNQFKDFETFHDYYINNEDIDYEDDAVYIHIYSKFKDYQFYQCVERIRNFIDSDDYFKQD